MPSTQRRPSLRNIRRSPQNPQLVHFLARLAIRYKNVEHTLPHGVQHVKHGLSRTPTANWLGIRGVRNSRIRVRPLRPGKWYIRFRLGCVRVRNEADVHEEMRSHIGIRSFAELVCKPLRKTFNSCLGGVIRSVSPNACTISSYTVHTTANAFGACVDDHGLIFLVKHRLQKEVLSGSE